MWLFSSSVLFAQDGAAEQQVLQETLAKSIGSMFLEKESPFLHIRWGTRIFVDVPLRNEPQGASPTLRKAELKLSRRFGKNLQFKITGNYSNGRFEAGNSYVVYSGWKTSLLTLGIQTPPFSLEATSSSSALSLMEQALPVAALAENKNAALNILKRSSRSILSTSLVFFTTRQDGIQEPGEALVTRYVYSPIDFHGRKNFHLGGSFSYRFLKSDTNVELKSRPEIGTANVYYIDTGAMSGGDRILRLGLEASEVRGRFSWQAEALSAILYRKNAESLNFWGSYFHLSQFLTNDSRNYDQGSGTFAPVVPNNPIGKGGIGAFELAFRASYADLSDKDIIGGRESNLSIGLNWYLNDKVRLMANAIKVLNVDRPGSEYDGLDPMIFGLRWQWLVY